MDYTPYIFHGVSTLTVGLLGYLMRELRSVYRQLATKEFVQEMVKDTIDKSNEEQLAKINGTYIRRSEMASVFGLKIDPPHGPHPHHHEY